MLDFNGAEVQKEGGAGAIPPDSIIPFKMTIRPPKAGKEGNSHAVFCKSDKGNEYIDVEFEALGTFAGRKIWQNFTLVGSEQAAAISMRTLRAIIESARGIAPSDSSPTAAAGRQLSDWLDFNSMTFLAKVGCKLEKSNKDGITYINNEIKRVITPDDAEYAAGESISDKPLPVVPDSVAAPAAASPAAAPEWGTGVPATAAQPAAAKSPMPTWAAK